MTSNPIGRYAKIRVGRRVCVGNVIDARDNGLAKRIRIQTQGPYQGRVVQPHEYKFLEFAE